MTEAEFLEALSSRDHVIFDETATDGERTLQGHWLTAAARAGLPIRVSRGKIVGLVVLDTMRVSHFELISCELENLSAQYATFTEWFRVETCSFSGYCWLRGSRFESAVWFRGTHLAGNLDLGYVSIGVDLDLDGLDCAKRVYLVGAAVQKNVHLRSSTFRGDFEMALANVTGQFDAQKSRFLGKATFVDSSIGGFIAVEASFESDKGDEVLFDRMAVNSGVNFTSASFGNTTSFGGLIAKGQLIFDNASFRGDCRLEGVKANDGFFRSVTFSKSASFIGAHLFSGDFTDSTFEGEARFNDLKVDIALSLNGTLFQSSAIFDRLRLGESLRIASTTRKVIFSGPLTSFADANVGSQGIFSDVVFLGGAVFESAEFGGLILERCAFHRVASFVTMRCKGDACFIGIAFEKAEFHAADIGGNFGFDGCTFREPADISYVSSRGNLVFSNSKFCSEVVLKNSHTRGELSLISSTLTDALSLEMATCGALHFFKGIAESSNDKTPDLSKVKINAIGLRYGHIYCVWRDYVAGVAASQLHIIDPYVQLERYLRTTGAYYWADEVYILGRQNLRKALPKGSARYRWDVALDFLSGYGLRPLRTLLALAVLLAIIAGLIAFVHGFADTNAVSDCVSAKGGLPDFEVAVNLAVSQYVPWASETVSGWRISECPLLGSLVRPYSVVWILRLAGLVLIPFVVTSLGGILRYIGPRN